MRCVTLFPPNRALNGGERNGENKGKTAEEKRKIHAGADRSQELYEIRPGNPERRAVVLSGGKKIADDKPSNILTNKEIIKKANLKETSLSTLAKTIDIANTNDFVQFFIDLER